MRRHFNKSLPVPEQLDVGFSSRRRSSKTREKMGPINAHAEMTPMHAGTIHDLLDEPLLPTAEI